MVKKLIIVKIGGGIIDNSIQLNSFLYEFSKIQGLKILVHGGGRMVNDQLQELGLKPNIIKGRRITDKSTLKIAIQMYAGLINKNIVAELQRRKVNAIGLSGADGNVIFAKKRPIKDINFGFVGDLNENSINVNFIEIVLKYNLTPIFCAITHDKNGNLLNTNADTIAAHLAIALCDRYETELHYCFEKIGVLENINEESTLFTEINYLKYIELKDKNIIFEGMIPKLDNAFEVLNKGVKKVVLEHPANINTSIKTTLIK